MYETYERYDISYKNTLDIKKIWLSKVESYLEVNAWIDWQQPKRSDIGVQAMLSA